MSTSEEDISTSKEDMPASKENTSTAIEEDKEPPLETKLKRLQALSALNQAQSILGLRSPPPGSKAHENERQDKDCSCAGDSPKDSVLASLDVECWEEDATKVTEIGISILDPRQILDKPPGKSAFKWKHAIASHHIRIGEYAYLRNEKFVKGRPEDFRFGNSEFVPFADVPRVLGELFSNIKCCGKPRSIVIVGHAVNQDLTRVAGLKFDIMKQVRVNPNWPTLDTQQLFRAVIGEDQNSRLGTVLVTCGIDPFGMHNAGNDAFYTMRALLAMAVRTALPETEEEEVIDEELNLQDPEDWS